MSIRRVKSLNQPGGLWGEPAMVAEACCLMNQYKYQNDRRIVMDYILPCGLLAAVVAFGVFFLMKQGRKK